MLGSTCKDLGFGDGQPVGKGQTWALKRPPAPTQTHTEHITGPEPYPVHRHPTGHTETSKGTGHVASLPPQTSKPLLSYWTTSHWLGGLRGDSLNPHCGKRGRGTEFPIVAGAGSKTRRQAQPQGAAGNSRGSEPPKRGGTPAPSPAQCKYVSLLCAARFPPTPFLAVSNLPTILRIEGIFPILQLRARTQKRLPKVTAKARSQAS